MKVTIEFGHSRVVVPFNHDQTVNQLMIQAADRYKKLLSKPCQVHKLETKEGALLCGDDLLGDVIEDKDKLVAEFDDFDELEDEDTIEEFSMSSKKEPPFNHPRLAGDASLGLSPIHNIHRRGKKLDEPATSSPMTSLLENAKVVPLQTNPQPFQRGGKNRSTTSRLSSDIDLTEVKLNQDDEGFYSSDAHKNEFYQHSLLLSLRGGTSDIGVKLSDWKNMGLKVDYVESGSIADMEDYFTEGDGILEIDQIQLNQGTFSYRSNIFYERTQRNKFVIRLVTKDKIEEIESLDSRKSCSTVSGGSQFHSLQSALKDVTNSRRVGQVLTVTMIKAASGLGFTIVSRDTAGAGESPMLINRITPNGIAAKSDLCIGDRLLALNDREIGCESQATVVSWLKQIQPGDVVNLKVSRVNTVNEPSDLIEHHFDINIGSYSGLGLQLKSPKNSQHEGLFIESIVKNGAAEQDGRLQENDQIISISGTNLVGLSNRDALNIVRRLLAPDALKP